MIPTIALVGRPNVGKSTLFNKLTRSRDALVADVPGLTRDRRYGRCEINGQTVTLIDADGDDTDNDVTALGLRIDAGKGVGLLAGNSLSLPVNALETSVDTLSVWVAGDDGINILEADTVTVGDVVSPLDGASSVTVERVGVDSTSTTQTEAIQSDLVTTNTNGDNGSIVLRTEAGSITLTDGTAPDDGSAVSAHGSGNVLIAAEGAGTSITAEDVRARLPELRDTAIMTLSEKSVEDLNKPGGKINLRAEIFKRLEATIPDGRLMNVYFSDLVIQ
mgnify:CR=1 FL=1